VSYFGPSPAKFTRAGLMQPQEEKEKPQGGGSLWRPLSEPVEAGRDGDSCREQDPEAGPGMVSNLG